MVGKLLNLIDEKYPLSEKTISDMASLKAKGMTFSISAYNASGLGHVSVMRANGFFGLMKMDTVIINPTEIDLPLYSYDRIFMAGNDMLIVELYDTLCAEFDNGEMNRVKEKYASIPERDPGVHWYDEIKLESSISKKGKKKNCSVMDSLAEEHFSAYLSSTERKTSDLSVKQSKACDYVEGLLKRGGPSTDVFKKSFGEEFTAKLFREVLFGI